MAGVLPAHYPLSLLAAMIEENNGRGDNIRRYDSYFEETISISSTLTISAKVFDQIKKGGMRPSDWSDFQRKMKSGKNMALLCCLHPETREFQAVISLDGDCQF